MLRIRYLFWRRTNLLITIYYVLRHLKCKRSKMYVKKVTTHETIITVNSHAINLQGMESCIIFGPRKSFGAKIA
jgi:hypothetical protein